jgi:protocatechuate 3,4-dioxygenase beta subunit
MRSLLVLLVFLTTLVEGQQDTPPGQNSHLSAPKQQTCTLEGRVINVAGGTPIRKATVRLSAENNGMDGALSATTDAQGKFAFSELSPGHYSLMVLHPSFLTYPHRRGTRAQMSSTVYTLTPGQQVKDVLIQMTPGAVLRGHVTDEEGDAVVRAQVTVVSAEQAGRAAARVNGGGSSTDDQGEFRVFSLPPGRYYVKASPSAEITRLAAGAPKVEDRVYVPTFYPGATDRDSATPLELRGGDEISINIALQRGVVYSVTGTLKNGKGALVSHGVVMAMQSHGAEGQGQVKDGKFEMHLPSGHYTLMGIGLDEGFSPGQMPSQGHKGITVAEGDLRGVELILGGSNASTTQVNARLRTEGGTLPPGQRLLVALQRMNPKSADEDDEDIVFTGQGGGFAQSKPDGSFEMKDVTPGTYEVVIASMGSGLEDWYTKAVLVGNRDALNSGVTVSGSALQLEIVISPAGGSVEGTVQDRDRHPAANALVVLVPDAARGKRHSLYEIKSADQNGHFLMRGLEPGEYTAYAWDDIEDDAWFNPDMMKRYKEDGTSVTVRAAEKTQVQVRLIANLQKEAAQ